jgi:hypothetical protein
MEGARGRSTVLIADVRVVRPSPDGNHRTGKAATDQRDELSTGLICFGCSHINRCFD